MAEVKRINFVIHLSQKCVKRQQNVALGGECLKFSCTWNKNKYLYLFIVILLLGALTWILMELEAVILGEELLNYLTNITV